MPAQRKLLTPLKFKRKLASGTPDATYSTAFDLTKERRAPGYSANFPNSSKCSTGVALTANRQEQSCSSGTAVHLLRDLNAVTA
jgi:hypothetical protein